MSASKFAQRVPLPTRSSPSPLDFYRALRASATLRLAVEQIRASGARMVWRDDSIASFPRMWTDDESQNFLLPAEQFHGGRRWNHDTERSVRRRVFDALLAWDFLCDAEDESGDATASVKRWVVLMPDEVAAIALDLVRETRSAQRMLNHPAWQWFGIDRNEVSREMFDAASRGLLRFDECGSVAEIRFRDPVTGAFYDAAEAVEEKSTR